MTELETECLWYDKAFRELKIAEERGDKDDSGSCGYREMGCYDCDGSDKTCRNYLDRIPEVYDIDEN